MVTRLILITRSFPYESNESSFLQYEIKYLQKQFDEIIIIPEHTDGQISEINGTVTVEDGFSNYLKQCIQKRKKPIPILKTVFSYFFIRELLKKPKVLFKKRGINTLFLYLFKAYYIKKWLHQYFWESSDLCDTIIYTYWNDYKTLGAGLFIKNYKSKAKLVSRAHRYDLYENEVGYLPCYKENLKLLDRLFLISEDGKNYLQSRYTKFVDKYYVSRLGVKKSSTTCQRSNDNKLRIVSCSNIVSVKRVELILFSLLELVNDNSNKIEIEWVHFGDGFLKKDLESKIELYKNKKLKIILKGNRPNSEIISHYSSTPVDCFINVSKSEGIPVSIMEAISFGIPVIATNVGGTSEIVNDVTGRLLEPNPTAAEIAEIIFRLYNDERENEICRDKIKQFFSENYDEQRNYSIFSVTLKSLLE